MMRFFRHWPAFTAFVKLRADRDICAVAGYSLIGLLASVVGQAGIYLAGSGDAATVAMTLLLNG
jgi:hypothetical protein